MDKMLLGFNAILPSFLLIGLGWVARKALNLQKKEIQRFNQVVFYFLLPVMVFNNIYQGDFSEIGRFSFVLVVVCLLILVFVISLVLAVLAEPKRDRRGVIVQACIRSNFILLGMTMLKELCPQANLSFASSLMAVYILLANISSVIVLEYFSDKDTDRKAVLLSIFKNPLIIASALGMLFCALHIRLPLIIDKTFSQIESSTTPIALLLLGAALETNTIRKQTGSLVFCLALRLIAIPFLAFLTGLLLHVGREDAVLLLGFFATPPSVSSYNMVCAIGGDADYAANVAVLTNILSVLSLVIWIVIFQIAGLI